MKCPECEKEMRENGNFCICDHCGTVAHHSSIVRDEHGHACWIYWKGNKK